jgi:hypothetical protein
MKKVNSLIELHLKSLPAIKSNELRNLHNLILAIEPKCKLWFDNGINDEGKVLTNPTIGYGHQTLHYAKGDPREFFQIGICATTTGISIYLIGIRDKKNLKEAFAPSIGKATITGYCVKYKRLSDLNSDTLTKIIQFGFSTTSF